MKIFDLGSCLDFVTVSLLTSSTLRILHIPGILIQSLGVPALKVDLLTPGCWAEGVSTHIKGVGGGFHDLGLGWLDCCDEMSTGLLLEVPLLK